MSKYTDMLADKYRCHCGTCEVQKGNVSEEECKICSHYAIREALQIADRLEQMWEEVKDKEFPHSMFQNCRDCGDYMQGKKDALADIRGENND